LHKRLKLPQVVHNVSGPRRRDPESVKFDV
jgi:hypothetical protein